MFPAYRLPFDGHWKHYHFIDHKIVVQICRSWKKYYSICSGRDFRASRVWFHHEPQNWVWRKTHQRKVEFSEISCKHPFIFSCWLNEYRTFLFILNFRSNYANTVLLTSKWWRKFRWSCLLSVNKFGRNVFHKNRTGRPGGWWCVCHWLWRDSYWRRNTTFAEGTSLFSTFINIYMFIYDNFILTVIFLKTCQKIWICPIHVQCYHFSDGNLLFTAKHFVHSTRPSKRGYSQQQKGNVPKF